MQLIWENSLVSIPVAHDYMEDAIANIQGNVKEAEGAFGTFEEAAEFYLDNNIDNEKALAWAQRSVELNEVFWNTYTLSRALAENGKMDDAIRWAERSLELSKEADYQPYVERNEKNLAAWRK